MKDVENPVGLFSTELKAYKVRGGMKERRELESQLGDGVRKHVRRQPGGWETGGEIRDGRSCRVGGNTQ